MQTYPLWSDSREAGKVTVERKGLFYQFTCICNANCEVSSRICVCCGEKTTDLGICVPEKGYFSRRTQIPIKYVGEGQMEFFIKKSKTVANIKMQLFTDRPFSGLETLEKARLTCKDGFYYIHWD